MDLEEFFGKSKRKSLASLLLDADKKPQERALLLVHQCLTDGDPAKLEHIFTRLFEQTDKLKKDPSPEAAKLKARYEQALLELVEGPVKAATYVGKAAAGMPGVQPRVHVLLPDGSERYPTLHPSVQLHTLVPGCTVFTDPKAAVVLGSSETLPQVGTELAFQRAIPGGNLIEVQLRDEKAVVYAGQSVLDAIADGSLKRDDRVLVCPTRRFAFLPIPPEADKRHRFVDSRRLPRLDLRRDLGNPHWSLGWLYRRMRLLMFHDDVRRRIPVRPRISLLMIGGPGTGKTFTIKALLHTYREMLVERTGLDEEEVGSRVIRFKMSELLSEWLGVSDKNIDRLFDDILELAREPVRTADGQEVLLPVIVIAEEADGMGANRDGVRDGAGGAYNRILTTLLQRFDDPIDELGHLPICFISTTNKPGNLDAAMFRRLGGKVAYFGRLDRNGFSSVLSKKVGPGFPLASNNGYAEEELRQRLVEQVTTSLYAPADDETVKLELTLSDGAKLKRHARHFATPALIEQAVSSAVDQLAFAAAEGESDAVGLTAELLMETLEQHIDAVADTVNRYNVEDYLDVPENAVVAGVRRVRKPAPPLAALIDQA